MKKRSAKILSGKVTGSISGDSCNTQQDDQKKNVGLKIFGAA